MTPSRRIQSRIDSIESSIERMKQAEHCGVARLPLDLVERVAAGNREEALHAEPGALLDDRVHDLLGHGFAALNLLDACHLPSRNSSLGLLLDRTAGTRFRRRGRGP